MIVAANVFPILQIEKTWQDYPVKSAVSEHPSAVNMLNGHKHL